MRLSHCLPDTPLAAAMDAFRPGEDPRCINEGQFRDMRCFDVSSSCHGGLSHVTVGVTKNLNGPREQKVLVSAIVAHRVPLYSM